MSKVCDYKGAEMMLWVFRNIIISQSTDSISLIRLPIKYPFTWTEGTGSSWQTPLAVQISIQTFAGNTVIFSASHNKYLTFYGPIISHRNKAICLANIFSPLYGLNKRNHKGLTYWEIKCSLIFGGKISCCTLKRFCNFVKSAYIKRQSLPKNENVS